MSEFEAELERTLGIDKLKANNRQIDWVRSLNPPVKSGHVVGHNLIPDEEDIRQRRKDARKRGITFVGPM